MFKSFSKLSTLFLIFWLILLGCNKKKEQLPLHGTIIWNAGSGEIRADSFAIVTKNINGPNGRPFVQIYGVSFGGTTLQISLDSAAGTGVFIAGNSPTPNLNGVYAKLSGKEYKSDYGANITTVNITVSEQNGKKIKGSFNGDVNSSSGEKIPIAGSFDMDF